MNYRLGGVFLMINTKKTRLMTQCAIYRKHEGVEDLKIAGFFKEDFIRLEMLKTILAITLGYLIILGMVIIYYSEFLIAHALNLNYKMFGKKILGYYLLILVIYIVIALSRYGIVYLRSHKRLSKYYKMLGRIKKISIEQEHERELEEENWEELQA